MTYELLYKLIKLLYITLKNDFKKHRKVKFKSYEQIKLLRFQGRPPK